MAAAYVHPIHNTVLGGSFFKFGDKDYSEQSISMGAAHSIQITSLGAKINYVQYHQISQGYYRTVTLDVGGITQLTPRWAIGAYVRNVTQSMRDRKTRERIPTEMFIGSSFKPAEYILCAIEIEKDLTQRNPLVKAGIEYNFRKHFFARTGFSFKPQTAYFGIGMHRDFLKADLSFNYGTVLSYFVQASMAYEFYAWKKTP